MLCMCSNGGAKARQTSDVSLHPQLAELDFPALVDSAQNRRFPSSRTHRAISLSHHNG
jgi:hypothetical protein